MFSSIQMQFFSFSNKKLFKPRRTNCLHFLLKGEICALTNPVILQQQSALRAKDSLAAAVKAAMLSQA